jgi:hypothetical protein
MRAAREVSKMNIQPLLTGLTLVNLGLSAFLVAKAGVGAADGAPSVLRGSAIEIVDGNGKLRATLGIVPAGTTADGNAYPETVLFRLIDGSGQPSVKISTSGVASGISLVGGDDESYVVVEADGPASSLKLVGPDGRQRVVTP